jgi:hypothetical protein
LWDFGSENLTVFQANHVAHISELLHREGKSKHTVLLPPGQRHQWDKICIARKKDTALFVSAIGE